MPSGAAVTLGQLLRRLARVPGIARLRYMTSHPRDMLSGMCDDLIAAHGDLPALMPYVHLPVQSGSDRILAAMNRKHTRKEYLEAIARLRAARADLAFTSDFIVGFPGETEAGFPRHAGAGRRGQFRHRLHLHVFDRAPARRRQPWKTRFRKRKKPSACSGCRPSSPGNGGRLMPLSSAKPWIFCSKSRASWLGNWSAAPHICSRCMSWRAPELIGSIVKVTITDVGTNTLFGALAETIGEAARLAP